MNNRKTITVMTSMIIALSLGVLAPNMAQAQTSSYFSGEYWSYTDPDHTNELHNGSVPFAVDTARLRANLDLASGTTINDIYTDIDNAIVALDATDLNIVRKDTTTFYHDNKISSTSMHQDTGGVMKNKDVHWKWIGFKFTNDKHLQRAQIFFNDADNVSWTHTGGSRSNHEMNPYNVVIHELGHAVGLCDTYDSGNKDFGLCTGVTDTRSIMSNSGLYQSTDKALTATDTATLNRAY